MLSQLQKPNVRVLYNRDQMLDQEASNNVYILSKKESNE